MNLRSESPEQTMAFGAVLARRLAVGTCVLLDGPLGAGKTTLVRGILRERGVTGPVRSPTYNLVHEYATKPPIAHADLYRLAGEGDVASLGLDELLMRGALVLEWPDRAPGLLPGDALTVRIGFAESDTRDLVLLSGGPQSERLRSLVEEDVETTSL
jgi:tRNA threonylcarbamoyladenosine biosynthesis protein TsaE